MTHWWHTDDRWQLYSFHLWSCIKIWSNNNKKTQKQAVKRTQDVKIFQSIWKRSNFGMFWNACPTVSAWTSTPQLDVAVLYFGTSMSMNQLNHSSGRCRFLMSARKSGAGLKLGSSRTAVCLMRCWCQRGCTPRRSNVASPTVVPEMICHNFRAHLDRFFLFHYNDPNFTLQSVNLDLFDQLVWSIFSKLLFLLTKCSMHLLIPSCDCT